MPIHGKDGFLFNPEALTVRIAAECKRLNITTRAQAIAAWAGLTPAVRTMFLGKLLLGAIRFPDDSRSLNPYQVGSAPTVPGPGE
jgi:hypothetical protein